MFVLMKAWAFIAATIILMVVLGDMPWIIGAALFFTIAFLLCKVLGSIKD